MRIDSHQHFWKFDAHRDSWITENMQILRQDFLPAHLDPYLKQNDFHGCVAIQADQSESENDFLLSLAAEHDFIKGVVGWIDIKSPDLNSRLEQYYVNKKLKGFRHIVQGERAGFLIDKKFIGGVNDLGKAGYTYDLLIYPHQLDEALYFVHKVPEVKVVIDHMAKPSIMTGEKTHWELHMAMLATFQNVYCKVSGLVTEADWGKWTKDQIFPYIDEILEVFGPDRMMYGSDWPVCLLSAEYDEQLNIVQEYISKLSESEQEKIMGDNAFKFYNL